VPHLVKADALEFAAEVDALGTNAEDAVLLQSTLCVDGPNRHSGGQRWRHRNCHNVQHADNHRSRRLLHSTHTHAHTVQLAEGKRKLEIKMNGVRQLATSLTAATGTHMQPGKGNTPALRHTQSY